MAAGGRGGGGGSVIATAVVVVRIDDTLFNRQLGQIRNRLNNLNMPNIRIGLDPNAIRQIMAQINQIRAAAARPIQMNIQGGPGGGGGGVGGLLGRSLTGMAIRGGIRAAGAVAGAAPREAIAMEASLAEVGRLAGYAKGQLAQVRQAFEAISTSGAGAPMDELFSIAGFGARAGIGQGNPAALIQFTEGMAKIRTVINDLDIDTVASEMAKIMTVFEVGAEHTEGLASGLAALDKSSQATAGEILDITQRLSGFATSIKMTLPQTMALASAIRDVGLPVEAGSTALIRIMTKLETEGQAFADALGIGKNDFSEAMRRGPIAGLQMVLDKLGQIDDAGARIRKIFDKEGGLGLHNVRDIAALSQIGAKLGEFPGRAEMVEGEINTKKTLEEGVKARAETAQKHLEALSESMMNLAAALGDPLLPSIKSVADAMNNAATLIRMKMQGIGWFADGPGVGPQPGQPGGPAGPPKPKAKGFIEKWFPQFGAPAVGFAQKGPEGMIGDAFRGFFNKGFGINPNGAGGGAPLPPQLQANPPVAKKGPNVAGFVGGLGNLMKKGGKIAGFLGREAGVLGEAVDAKGKLNAAQPEGTFRKNWQAMWDQNKIEGPFRAQTFEGGMDFGRSFQEGILSKEDTGKEQVKILGDIKKGIDQIQKDANKFLGIKNKMPALLD